LNILYAVNTDLSSSTVVIVGSGIAGSACAQALAVAGCAVQVVDRARGVGGRLATRRLAWSDDAGHRVAALDHGAPAFGARGDEFREWLAGLDRAGIVTPWWPALAADSRPLDQPLPLYLPRPDMPSLCRWLLRGVPVTSGMTVDGLRRGPQGWQLESAGASLPGRFDAVVLAIPPARAAALLAPHRSDWAQRASLALMQPCWTLMGVSRRPARGLRWDLGRPEQGPLGWVVRNDAKPGREPAVDDAHWVLHARPSWSRQHLEQTSDWVQARMQAALQDWLGESLEWRHAVVQRWRHATPHPAGALLRQGWWDSRLGLGVCGDFLGGAGVEGAWLSAQSVSESILQSGMFGPAVPAAPGSALSEQGLAA
jgi:predicted NAD/FAD-dependent oxidoreductase